VSENELLNSPNLLHCFAYCSLRKAFEHLRSALERSALHSHGLIPALSKPTYIMYCLAPTNPDITGIGVRVGLYLQAFVTGEPGI
jgi:hypothetical protein